MSNLLSHIKEYFNTFNHKDYTIYVDGVPTKWCRLNTYGDYVVWNIPSEDESDWWSVHLCEIEAIKLTATTMEIIKTNGKEYTLTAKLKRKEDKAKEIILRVKNAIYTHRFDDAIGYLDELNDLMDE